MRKPGSRRRKARALQRWAAKRPHYKTIRSEGPDGRPAHFWSCWSTVTHEWSKFTPRAGVVHRRLSLVSFVERDGEHSEVM